MIDLGRRGLLALPLCLAATSFGSRVLAHDSPQSQIRAVLFDAFTLFDPRPLRAAAEAVSPGLWDQWRTSLFEYGWLSVLAERYEDFDVLKRAALIAACERMGLTPDPERIETLIDHFSSLEAWPDAAEVLIFLRERGVRTALLSNFSPSMLAGCLRTSGLDRAVDSAISTDVAKTYKPATAAYRLGEQFMGIPREEIVFCAFAGWDAFGAKAYGYRTFWNNRASAPRERIGQPPDWTSPELGRLLAITSRA